MGRRAIVSAILCGAAATLLMPSTASAQQDRVSATEKGSLLIWSKVELRWDSTGEPIQDTFISLTNDQEDDVDVQLYFIIGDAPEDITDCGGNECFAPGWDFSDVGIELTGNQPLYWSALNGEPVGISPFTVLDGDCLKPGRPDPCDPAYPCGERYLRGYIIGWAVNAQGEEIRHNHLKGEATIVNYQNMSAWEYNAWAFQAVAGTQGSELPNPGALHLDGNEYVNAFNTLILNFQATGSVGFDGIVPVGLETDLTLHPVSVDLRQETCGPVTTKAHFDVWNMNEVKLSEARQCVTCWDQRLLSKLDSNPNHFSATNLQTDNGKARIDGKRSMLCDDDFDLDPNSADFLPPHLVDFGDDGLLCTADAGGTTDESSETPKELVDPRDLISVEVSLLGVHAKELSFVGGVDGPEAVAGGNLIGSGTEAAYIYYDVMDPSEEVTAPEKPVTPAPQAPRKERQLNTLIDSLIGEIERQDKSSSRR